jgi:hypothetical protein
MFTLRDGIDFLENRKFDLDALIAHFQINAEADSTRVGFDTLVQAALALSAVIF